MPLSKTPSEPEEFILFSPSSTGEGISFPHLRIFLTGTDPYCEVQLSVSLEDWFQTPPYQNPRLHESFE
jgi:hypothetical protein